MATTLRIEIVTYDNKDNTYLDKTVSQEIVLTSSAQLSIPMPIGTDGVRTSVFVSVINGSAYVALSPVVASATTGMRVDPDKGIVLNMDVGQRLSVIQAPTKGAVTADSPASGMVDVTPSSSNLPGGACRGLLVTVAGNLQVTCADGSTPTTFPVVAGQTIPVSILKVNTLTTATVKAYYGFGI